MRCVNLETISNAIAFCYFLNSGRIGGGAFISVLYCASGVFAPSRENENKTIHGTIQYPFVVYKTKNNEPS